MSVDSISDIIIILMFLMIFPGGTMAAAINSLAGGKDRRQMNGQALRQHPYPRT
jgi:hypothetical protein